MRFVPDRRRLLKTCGSIPLTWALSGVGRVLSQTLQTDTGGMIDVHCHIFNASDVPVRGFVQRVLLGDEEDQVVFESDPMGQEALIPWIAAFLVKLMAGPAPTAEQERLEIVRGVASEQLEQASPYEHRVAEALKAVLGDIESTESGALGRELLLAKIAEEIGAGTSEESQYLEEMDYLVTARRLLTGKGPLSRHIRFAKWLAGDRRKLLAEMLHLYGGSDRVALFTPALVDFSGWLDDEQRSDLESQIQLLERMQRMPWEAAHVHGFVAFNPWRQIEDVEANRSPTAFDLVEAAIEDMGFVGIKLYPPMGFLPQGNASSGLQYPERAADIADFPKKIDSALDGLYAWAAEEGVPIMAHATNSQGAGEGYSLRARPDRWAYVLEKYPSLRLNLGHFGRFDEAGNDADLANTWEYLFGEVVEAGASNVFADLSYLSEVLPGGTTAEHRFRLLNHLRSFIQKYDPNCERLMYGSDFAMLMREANYEDYQRGFRLYSADLGLSESGRSRIFGANAARFLGLGPNASNRKRLEAYYAKHRLDVTWLSQFD